MLNFTETTSAPGNTESNISAVKETISNQNLTDSSTGKTDKDLEHEEAGLENIKPSTSVANNASDLSQKVEEVANVSLITSSPAEPASAAPESKTPSNNTSPPQGIITNSSESNQSKLPNLSGHFTCQMPEGRPHTNGGLV